MSARERAIQLLSELVGAVILARAVAHAIDPSIIVDRLLSMELSHGMSGLVYWNGQYVEINHDTDLDLLAEVSIPLAHVR